MIPRLRFGLVQRECAGCATLILDTRSSTRASAVPRLRFGLVQGGSAAAEGMKEHTRMKEASR